MEAETGQWRKALSEIESGSNKCRIQQIASEVDQLPHPLGLVRYPEILAFYFRKLCPICIFYNLDTHEIDSIELQEIY